MNEYNDVPPEMPDSVQQRRPEQSADQFSNLANIAADNELETVLSELEVLPFQDENQKTVFFENVQRLHGRHIIQIVKLGVVPLQTSTSEPSQLLEEVVKLFHICLSCCYTADVSKRVAFEYYAKALKFCFPSQPTNCLSTAVVSKLLELVQIFQEGKLASIVDKTEQVANPKMQINGTKHFFVELLAIFETRRDDGYIAEIVEQTNRFASADASLSCIKEPVVGNVPLRSDHVVSPVLLTNWIKLLKLANVSSGFACALAKLDKLRCTKQCVPLFFYGLSFLMRDVYDSTVCYFVEILEEMKSSGSEVSLPTDEERMGIFFKYINHFCQHRHARTTSLKLLVTTSITNEVLREVLDLFFKEEERPIQQFQHSLEIKTEAFDHLFKVLSLLPDGKLVNKLLTFWRETFLLDPDYQHCAYLLDLFVEVSSSGDGCGLQERAERTLNFLHWLPSYLLCFLTFWCPFLAPFIKAFPTSFQRRPEVLVFIHRAVIAARVPAETRQAYVTFEQLPLREFLQWISQQSFTEEMKNEMIWLLMCCTDGGSLGHNWGFSIDTIKQLNLCQQLPFSTKKVVLRDLTGFAKLFKDKEKSAFRECVESIASNQTLKLKDEIFFEILDFMKRFADKETIPADVLQLLSLVSQISISGDRRVKLLQMSKESGKGLENGLRILELMQITWCGLDETNKHFDLLYSVFVDILKQESDLCKRFCEQVRQYWPSAQVQEVWSFEVAKLISLDSLKEDIDCRCCCQVLNAASGLTSPEMLQLISQVRSSAEKVVHLLREQNDIHATPSGSDCVPEPFVSSLEVIVKSNVLSGNEKLLLVKKVCDIFVKCPDSLSEQSMENALSNLIPFPSLHDNICLNKEDVVRLELNQIEAMLENQVIMAQLSRIPVNMYLGKSLSTVLSVMNSEPFSTHNIADIYHFIGSQEDLDQAFFDNLLSILEVVIQESKSVEYVLEILMDLVCILRSTPSELISFTILNYENLLKNHVNKQERFRFLNEVVMKWDFSPNVHVLSYLEVPRLLWKAYTTAKTPAERCSLIDRLQQVLKKTNEQVCIYCSSELCSWDRRNGIVRKVDCCELEWLVLHSSLSNDEVALACNLIFRFCNQRLRCFTFYDVQNDEGCFKFVPQESEPETADIMSTTLAVGSTGKVSPTTEAQGIILTPVSIAQKVILHLKRLLGQEEDPTEKAYLFWDRAFGYGEYCNCREGECKESFSSLDDNVNVFLSILSEASSAEMLLHWINKERHHIFQCSEVVLKACKKRDDAEDIGEEAMLNFQVAVSTTMENIRMKTPDLNPFVTLMGNRDPVPCFRVLKPQLKNLSTILEHRSPIEVTTAVLALFETNVQAGVEVGEIVSFWSCKHQAMELVESFKMRCQEEDISSLTATHGEFVWQFLKAFGRFCMTSKDLLLKFEELMVLYGREDDYGFNRLPKWRQQMIAEGFSSHVIDCWCVAFLRTPLEDLSSRDVDAIADLNSRSLQLVAPVSQKIKSCIFPEDGFKVPKGKGINEPSIKKRLRLARLLGEFINILKHRKPEENRKDAVIKTIVVDACNELCKAHENQNRRRNDLYKIHGQMLKALFTEVFGKQRRPDGDVDWADMACQTVDKEARGELPVARQSSYLHESLPCVLSHNGVYEPLLVLLRRWLSQIVVKPTLASHSLEIVQLLFSVHPSVVDPDLLQRLHEIIKDRILSLEQNQVLIAQLHASGYNQNSQRTLWSPSKVECSGYLIKRESPDSRRSKKKLTQVLRLLWNEWKNILFMLGILSIKVGETDVCTKDLFGLQASLEEMEKQVSVVKEILNQIKSEDLERRIEQLMRQEQRHRARINKFYKGTKSSEEKGNQKGGMNMFVAVWENRFLENVKLCSEQIPGCYAPNGFHSEKPVLCALSVDNRIVTVFKEDKSGRREEIENVEVKLMEPGMYVFGLHPSGHDYVTDELWAAFFKMLLDERLVPSILLSNESPGFDWIKEYVKPVTSHPCPWKWELHQGIVPQVEDYFDYLPIQAALWPALRGLTEFVTLTRENVSCFHFKDFKDACAVEEKEKRTKEMTKKAIQELKKELRLLHGDDDDNEPIKKALVGKLSFAVKETIKSIIDGEHPTEETVMELIDMKKLVYYHPRVQRKEESKEQHAAAVTDESKKQNAVAVTEESKKQYAAAVTEETKKQYPAAVLRACKTALCDKC